MDIVTVVLDGRNAQIWTLAGAGLVSTAGNRRVPHQRRGSALVHRSPNWQALAVPALSQLIAEEMASYADPAVVRAVFGLTDPSSVAALVEEWVLRHLGSAVSDGWQWAVSVGCVAGLRLVDGSDVVVKVYASDRTEDALSATHDVQREARRRRLPAPLPLVGPTPLGANLATADAALRVGRRPNLRDPYDLGTVANGLARFIETLAPLSAEMAERLPAAEIEVCGLYPVPHSPLFDFEATAGGAEWIDDLARRARAGMDRLEGPRSMVHLDWRADNIRVSDDPDRVVAIYDWDAVRVQREAIAVGQVAAMHSVDWSAPGGPYFATGRECEVFAGAVEEGRGRPFSSQEWDALRAAIVHGWCYTARCEHARAAVGDDKVQFGMRTRLAADGETLLGRSPER